jgi:hypothetical protein
MGSRKTGGRCQVHFHAITWEPLVWFWCDSVCTYFMGISLGIVAQWDLRIFIEAAGLLLVDGFCAITREPLVWFWCNSVCTLIPWISRLGMLHSEIRAYLMRLLDSCWSMVFVRKLENRWSDFDVIRYVHFFHGYLAWDYCTVKSTHI